MKTIRQIFTVKSEGLLGKPITKSPLDMMHRYANVAEYTIITKGGLAEFIIKTSLFVSAMVFLRALLGMGVSDLLAMICIAGIIALYCYSLRSYLHEFVRAVSEQGFVGLACVLGAFVTLVGVALWV